ncbi:chromate efflux transporter [Acetobacteraceae bacterium H6797]|nr:chromate efflux transporter [Acetobacteraceae bacterium H6797]
MDASPTPAMPSLGEAFRLWARVGLLSFGGPAAQIAVMHREVVEERHWVSDTRFLHALNFCTLLPGPEAMQLATYLGWLMHGVKGGIIAGTLFVLPGAAVMLALSALYAMLGEVPLVDGLFFGLKAAVLVLVVQALHRLASRALHGAASRVLAIAAFLALFLLKIPFPIVVLAALALGFLWPGWFQAKGHGGAGKEGPPALLDAVLAADPGRPRRLAISAWRAGWACVLLWLAPVGLLLLLGSQPYAAIGRFFSIMAVVTFGGAYAVLAYVAQAAVEAYGWLSAEAMLAGLGLAETTPGPLILVLQFVGFMAGFAHDGARGGVLASLLTLWVTFMPCFAWIFLGAPFIEEMRGSPKLAGALAAVTAAVVGVIGQLALWFGLHVIFGDMRKIGPFDVPVLASIDLAALTIALLAAVAVFRFRLGTATVLGIAALGGLLARLALH